VLRGLCELHAWRGDAWSRDRIAAIVDHLVLPCRGVFASYPIDHRQGLEFGMHSGDIAARRDRWRLSTDVGAVFILLDGAVQAWSVVGGDALMEVCVEMAERFLAIDGVALGLQTHATLTSLRGLLRLASVLPGRGELVAAVAERFACYRSQGMTETWANHNWFGKPRWTEPCAIVDSLQVARQLWMATGDVRYRDAAQLIRWNGLVHGQRANGGFGPDTCTGSDPAIGGGGALLRPSVPEATWCCSMRGAEGLADVIQHQAVATADGWYLPWMEPCIVTDATSSVQVTGTYPDAGSWRIVRRGAPMRLHLAAPAWTGDWRVEGRPVAAAGGWVVVDLAADAEVTATCTLALERQERQGERNQPGWSAWRHGPCILAAAGVVARETPVGRPQRRGTGWELDGLPLLPLSASWRQPMVVAGDQRFAAWSRQVLWRDG
jgi:hypothetical protein